MNEQIKRTIKLFFFILVAISAELQAANHPNPTKSIRQFKPEQKTCKVLLNHTSAQKLVKSFNVFQPDFARLQLRFFNISHVGYRNDVIMPFDWVWTYYTVHGLFSYLKWPLDFALLSFGLLGAKILPDGHYLELIAVNASNCTLTIGELETTKQIAEALKDFSHSYIEKSRNEKGLDYSYWCYLAEIPGIEETMKYKLRIYTGYPLSTAGYNCCHTKHNITNASDSFVVCKNKQYTQSIESSLIPFAMSLVAFTYFPIALMKASKRLVKLNTRMQPRNNDQNRYISVEENPDLTSNETDEGDFVYLDGTAPICFTNIVSGLFGFSRKYPYAASRIRRALFVSLVPSIIYIRLLVYNKYLKTDTMAMLKHNCPLGYLSMLSGFENSRKVFLPALGGPYCLLLAYYIASVIFVILPSDIDSIFELGSERNYSFLYFSPMFSLKTLEKYSHRNILRKYGYTKVSAICSGGVFMLTNPIFWRDMFQVQFHRLVTVFVSLKHVFKKCFPLCIMSFVVLCPIVLVLFVFEIMIVIILYGFPVFNWMYVVVKSYTRFIVQLFQTQPVLSKLGHFILLKSVFSILIGIFFLYYVFSFCTIFTYTFGFLSRICVFSFLAIIVYPSTSFGYLFFGIVLVYYIFKMITGFGEGYVELLSEAVEASTELEDDPFRAHVLDGTLVISDTQFGGIRKLQIGSTTIELTIQQQNIIQGRLASGKAKVRQENYKSGIPNDLFMKLVYKYRPVHIQVALAVVKLILIMSLIAFTLSIITTKPLGANEGISEVMHVVFLLAIGALPRVLELAFNNMNHSVQKDIKLRKIKADILKYWHGADVGLVEENQMSSSSDTTQY
ncbi:uncharacterized protein LOC128207693 isoform X2 [Mya arenaria]|nr:uncharacterized protein LOC128207693 isoform X2 [Mya arenaria]